jgi:hypothetical protein
VDDAWIDAQTDYSKLAACTPPPDTFVDVVGALAIIDGISILSSDINKSLSEDHFMSNIPIEEAVDPKEVLEEMERLTRDHRALMPRLM